MNLETFLTYVTHRSESIIQWVFLAILVLAGILIARGLFGKKEEVAAAGAGPSPDLQAVLDKIMAQTAKLEGVSLQNMPAAGVAEVDAQVQALKKELASREEEIGKLKEAGSAQPAEDASKLNERIKELEAKLSEYEILEDDIADLSLYKEENTRLKAELDKVKGGGAPAASAAAAPAAEESAPAASAEAPQPTPQTGEAIVAEFAQAVSHDPASETTPDEALNMNIPDTGNPMADFESTVQLERKLTGTGAPAPAAAAPGEPVASAPQPEPELAPAPAASVEPAAAAVAAPGAMAAAPQPVAAMPAAEPAAPAAAAGAPAEADDLFAEFAQAPADPLEASTLDTDKMMEEMAALVSMEPATGNALEESIDIEKMAAEAGKKA